MSVTLRDKVGRVTSTEFGIVVDELGDTPGPWALRRKMGQAEIDLDQSILQRCGCQPIFVVILPVHGDEDLLRNAGATIEFALPPGLSELAALDRAAGSRQQVRPHPRSPAGRQGGVARSDEMLRNLTPGPLPASSRAPVPRTTRCFSPC